jgi:hypothetical protein
VPRGCNCVGGPTSFFFQLLVSSIVLFAIVLLVFAVSTDRAVHFFPQLIVVLLGRILHNAGITLKYALMTPTAYKAILAGQATGKQFVSSLLLGGWLPLPTFLIRNEISKAARKNLLASWGETTVVVKGRSTLRRLGAMTGMKNYLVRFTRALHVVHVSSPRGVRAVRTPVM